ncbi:MAG: hypothetical protein ACLTAY_11270 [Thomasclavelia ramosa]
MLRNYNNWLRYPKMISLCFSVFFIIKDYYSAADSRKHKSGILDGFFGLWSFAVYYFSFSECQRRT